MALGDITLNTPLVVGTADLGAQFYAVKRLDADRTLVLWREGSTLYGRIHDVNTGLGTKTTCITSYGASDIKVELLDVNTAVIAASAAIAVPAKIQILQLSGSTITPQTDIDVTGTTGAGFVGLTKLSSTEFAAAFALSSDKVVVRVYSTNGTTITQEASADLGNGSGFVEIDAINSTDVICAYKDNSNNSQLSIGTYNSGAGTLTFGTESVYNSGTLCLPVSIDFIGSGAAQYIYYDNALGGIWVTRVSFTGTTINSYSSPAQLETGNVFNASYGDRIIDDKMLFAWYDSDTTQGRMVFFQYDGTTLTTGTEAVFQDTSPIVYSQTRMSVDVDTDGNLAVGYSTGSSSPYTPTLNYGTVEASDQSIYTYEGQGSITSSGIGTYNQVFTFDGSGSGVLSGTTTQSAIYITSFSGSLEPTGGANVVVNTSTPGTGDVTLGTPVTYGVTGADQRYFEVDWIDSDRALLAYRDPAFIVRTSIYSKTSGVGTEQSVGTGDATHGIFSATSDRGVILYRQSSDLYASTLTYTGNSVTVLGTQYLIYNTTAIMSSTSSAKIQEDVFVWAGHDLASNTLRVGAFQLNSDNSISTIDDIAIETGIDGYPKLTVIDSSTLAVTYTDSTNQASAVLVSFNGTILTAGTPYVYTATGGSCIPLSIVQMGDKLVCFYDDFVGGNFVYEVLTYSGTTISADSGPTIIRASAGQVNVVAYKVDDTWLLTAGVDTATNRLGIAQAASLSGTTLTFGTSQQFDSSVSPTDNYAIEMSIRGGEFIIHWQDDSATPTPSLVVGTIDAGSASISFLPSYAPVEASGTSGVEFVSTVYYYDGQGTGTLSGTSPLQMSYIKSGFGIITSSGSANSLPSISYTSSGQASTSGAATFDNSVFYIPTGGIQATGSTLTDFNVSYTSSGLISSGGSATISRIIIETGQGSITSSGNASFVIDNKIYLFGGAGGGVVFGSATYVEHSNIYLYDGAGSFTSSGDAAIEEYHLFDYSGQGLISLSGDADTSVLAIWYYDGLGSITSSGAAVSELIPVYFANGVISVDGTADAFEWIKYFEYSMTGAPILSSSSTYSREAQYFYTGQGEINGTGIATIQRVYTAVVEGGTATLSGTVGFEQDYTYAGEGSISASGDGVEVLAYTYTSTGGITTSGDGVETLAYTYSGSGDALVLNSATTSFTGTYVKAISRQSLISTQDLIQGQTDFRLNVFLDLAGSNLFTEEELTDASALEVVYRWTMWDDTEEETGTWTADGWDVTDDNQPYIYYQFKMDDAVPDSAMYLLGRAKITDANGRVSYGERFSIRVNPDELI